MCVDVCRRDGETSGSQPPMEQTYIYIDICIKPVIHLRSLVCTCTSTPCTHITCTFVSKHTQEAPLCRDTLL